jgi:hypothetical protein
LPSGQALGEGAGGPFPAFEGERILCFPVDAIAWAADTMACTPEPHRRLTLNAGVSIGRPASIAANRLK